MAQFEQDGVIYEDLGNGQVKVVGYATTQPQAQPAAMTFGKPTVKEPEKPQIVKAADGSVVQVYADGTTRTVIGPEAGKNASDAKAPDAQKIANLRALERQIGSVRQLYKDNLAGGPSLSSIGEYLPFSQNRAFDSAGKALAETGFGAFRVPGVGSQSDAEGARFVEAYAPSASDQDAVIEQKLANLENRLFDTYREMGIKPLTATPQNQNIFPSVNEGRAFANDGTVRKTGNNGFDKYVTDQDRQRAETLQGAYERGASADELNEVAQGMGLDPFSPSDLNLLMGERAKGNRVRIAPFATGERSLSQQVLGAVADTPLGAYGGAALDAATLGFSDELVGAAMGERAGQLAQYAKEYSREQSPVASFLGDVTGGVALGGPLTSGVRLAGIKGAQAASPFVSKMTQAAAGSLPRAAVTAATLQGALTGAGQMNDNRLLGAAVGGGAGLGGGYIGSKLFGAGANAAMSGPATGGGNRVRGLFGGRQRPQIPTVDKPSQMVNATIGEDMGQILNRLTQAEELGAPMTLADQPQLTSLAGATVRRSPTAKTLADEIMEPRARGQYDRLIGAVERDLGPIANVPQLSDDLIKQARAQSEPLYRQAFDAPGASSVDVSGIVKTPMGNLAMQKAVGRVQNKLGPDGQPMDPSSLGFNIGAGNEVTLGQTPSFETLNYMKRGLDDIIEGGFDPIARSYTPEAQAATALKQNLVGQMDAVNPAYAQARSIYAGKAQERGALQQGQSALSMTPDTMNFQRQALSPSQQEQYGLGYRSAMSEQAGKARYSSNPFETAYGTPQAQQKIASLFPEGAERFGQQYDLERLIAKSKNEITGNSMTAARQNADADFAPGMLQAGMVDVATTGTPLVSGGRLLAKIGGDELGRIGAKRKAEALAPILFDADPAKNAAVLRELQKNIKVQKRAKGMFGGKSRALGAVSGGAPSVGFTLGLSE